MLIRFVQGLFQHVEGFSLKKRVIPISYYMIQVLIYWAQSTINNKVRRVDATKTRTCKLHTSHAHTQAT